MIWTVVVVICMWSSLGLETSGKVIQHFRRQDKNDLQRGSTVSSPKLRCNCCCTVTKTNVQLLCVCDTVTARSRRIHVGNGNVTTHCLQNGLNYTSELILHNLTFYARCNGHAGFHDLEKLHKVGVQRHGIPVLTFKLKIYHASTVLTCTAKWTNATGVKTFCITTTRSHKDMKCIIDKKDPRHEHQARLGSRPTDKTVQKLSLALEISHTLATAKHYWYLIIKCPKVTHNLSSSCHTFHVKLYTRASNKNETIVSLISCSSISNHMPELGKQNKRHKRDTKDKAELSVRHRRQDSTPATANDTSTNDSKDSSSNEALAIHYMIIYVLAAGVVGAIISAVTPRLLRLWRSHQAHIKEVMGNQASISTTSVDSGHLYESIPNINAPFHRRLHVTWSEIRTLSRDNVLTLSNTSIDDPDTDNPLLRSGSTGCPLHGNSHSKLPRRGIDSDGYMIPLPYMKSALAESLDNIVIDNTQPDTDTYVTPITPPESGSVSTRSSMDNLSTEAHSIGTNSAYHRESCFTSLYQSVRSLGSNSSYTEAPDSCTCEQCVDCLYAKGGQIHNSHHSCHMESLRSLPAQLCTEKGTMRRNICHGQNLPEISQDCRGQNVADERTLTMSSRLVHVEIKATTAHENVRRSLTYGEELERSARLNVNSIVQHLDHHQTLTTASRQSCQMCHHQHHVSLQPCKRAATYTPCHCGRHTSKQYHTLAPTQEHSSHTTKGKHQIKAPSQTHCPLHAQNTSPNTAAEQDYVNTSVPSERRPCPPPPRHQSSSDQLYINTIPPNRPNLPFPEPRMAHRQDRRDIPFQEPRKAQNNRDISLPEPRMAQRQDNRDISFLESGKAQSEYNKDIQFPEPGITQREDNGDRPFPEPIKDPRQDNRDIPCPEPGMAKRKDNRDTSLPEPRKAQRQDNRDTPIPVPRKAMRKDNSDKTASSMSLDRGLSHNMRSQGPQLQVPRCSGSAADLSNIYF